MSLGDDSCAHVTIFRSLALQMVIVNSFGDVWHEKEVKNNLWGQKINISSRKAHKNKQKVLAIRAIALFESFPAFELVVNPLGADALHKKALW